jgi:two-component system chemotaxis response regulator CheB
MTAKRLVVIGASAGGLDALRAILADIPGTFSAAVCVVLHMSPESRARLSGDSSPRRRRRVAVAEDRQRREAGRVSGTAGSPSAGGSASRKVLASIDSVPAIDQLFRSTAQVFGPNVIGVVLTGSLDDGTAGLWTIKRLGGIAVVQDPADAVFPSMPTNAIRHVDVDHVVPTARMASLLTQLTSVERAPEVVEVPPLVDVEVKVAKEENPQVAGVEEIGKPSPYACPDCSGVLLEIDEGGRIRFRCHTGHAYSSESLLAAMNDGTDAAMGVAVRALEEASLLMEEVARHLKQRNELDAFRQMLDGCDRTRRKAEAIRELILERDPVPTTE